MVTASARMSIRQKKEKIREGRARIEAIRKISEQTRPELKETAEELEATIDTVLDTIEDIAPESEKFSWLMRFVRRLTSREFIIAVVSILAIVMGDLEAQQALGVAIAGGGLALGRGVAKSRSGGSDQ